MKKISMLMAIPAFSILSLSSVSAHAVEMPSVEKQVSLFANYCVAGENAYNVGATLIAEDWITGKDADLIEEKEYQELFSNYVDYIDYGETTLYTKEFKYGAAIMFTDVKSSLCGVIPMYGLSKDKFESLMRKNNINLYQIQGDANKKGENYSYIFNNQVVNFTMARTEDGDISNITSSTLSSGVANRLQKSIKH